MASMPVIRDKTVLHILDGIRGLFDGGPGGRLENIWENRTLYFATDPVALDHIGWKDIEKKRRAMELLPIEAAAPNRVSSFVRRQVEHIEIAGTLGLGTFDETRIDLRKRALA
jgi:hypothetical protein